MKKLEVTVEPKGGDLIQMLGLDSSEENKKALDHKINSVPNKIMDLILSASVKKHSGQEITEEDTNKSGILQYIVDTFSQEEIVLALFVLSDNVVMDSIGMSNSMVEAMGGFEDEVARLTGTEVKPLEDSQE